MRVLMVFTLSRASLPLVTATALSLLPCLTAVDTAQAEDSARGASAAAESGAATSVEADRARKAELEQRATRNPLAITVYHRNYLMPWAYNSRPDSQTFNEIDPGGRVDRAEVKFQLSLKVGIADNIFDDNGDLYFAYTQRSWWQAYNSDASSPFRETNYQPEVFLSFDNDQQFFDWTNSANRIGLMHQSNGRSDPLSRSWNRIYLASIFQQGPWGLEAMPFWRIPESDSNDDNPDIEKYMGYADFTLSYSRNDQEFTWLIRGNPVQGNFGNQLDYSFPLFGKIRGFVQFYEGYGESLIDYDHYNRRLSLGFSLNTSLAGIPDTL
ncbi:phospholipase A [Kushneria sinocarnis]|nr:phospholipase A [Kushneria sinocarnis]